MTAKYCYARFRLLKNNINVSEYQITFTINSRKLKTKKLKLENNKSKDHSALLLSGESIKDCNAFVDMYIDNNIKVNSSPLILKVSDTSLKEGLSDIGFSRVTSINYLYTNFSFDVTSSNTKQNPNTRKTQEIRSLNNAPDIPYGLRWVAYLRNEITKSARKNNVDIMAIASIVFQEKYHGILASSKNKVSYLIESLSRSSSYGYGEMQLGMAADLLGLSQEKNPDYLTETFNIITTDAEIAIDLVGRNISNEQNRRNKKLSVFEATVFHNAGSKGLDSYIANKIPKERIVKSIYGRSWQWQNAIKLALTGVLIGQPDNCELNNCDAYIEKDVSVWKFNPSMKTQF